MPEPPHILVAWLTGVVSGFIASFVPGPIIVAIINEGARRGFKWGLMIGLGSTVMETIYCALAFAGFSTMLENRTVKAAMELVSFLLMLWLGIKYLRAQAVEERNLRADRIEQRVHPSSAFMTGFVQVLGNLGVLLMWIALTATFISHDWVAENIEEKSACVLGVATGALVWFLTLAFLVSRGRRKISPKTLLLMEHLSGVLLLILAGAVGVRIVLLLAKH
ncbi:MAG: LysE family transporter [Verrucomicrobiota bacterium]